MRSKFLHHQTLHKQEKDSVNPCNNFNKICFIYDKLIYEKLD